VKKTHGHARHGNETSEYISWYAMRSRCLNPRHADYPCYGGSGITICERWNSFETFLSDMGPKPSPRHTIERKDRRLGYQSANCCWATRKEQARNRSSNRLLTFEGSTFSVVEWSEISGLPVTTLRNRVRLGWPTAKILTTERMVQYAHSK